VTVVRLQESLRSELKEPLGPIYTDVSELLSQTKRPLIAVGDVVTYHIIEAGVTPDISLVDERTEREAVREEIADTLASFDGFDRIEEVTNSPATLSAELLSALREAFEREESTLLEVDGEEDLAALPAVLVAPPGASIVYGQPGEGMVHAVVDSETRRQIRELLAQMEGDTEQLWELLGVDS